MAHFAQIDENNIVIQVIVVSNEDCNNLEFPQSEEYGIKFCKTLLGEDTMWKQTSYNNNFRGIYAGIGMKYNDNTNEFIII